MSLKGIFIFVLVLIECSTSDYVRQLNDFNDPNVAYNNAEYLALKQKTQHVENLPNMDCDKFGCSIKVEKPFNIITRKTYGVDFKLENTGLNNISVGIYVKDISFNVSLDYKYTTPLVKLYYRNAFENYDESAYSDCVNNVGDENMFSVHDTYELGQKGKKWDYASRKSHKITLGPLSEESINCGHYWLKSLQTCFEIAAVVRMDRGITVFKLTDEVIMTLTLGVNINGLEKSIKVEGDWNKEQIVEFDENIKIGLLPIGKILNPIYGSYMIGSFSRTDFEDHNVNVTKWGHADNVPEKGSLSVTGLGRFQLTYVNNAKELLFDTRILELSGSIKKCSAFRNFNSGKSINRFKRRILDKYSTLADIYDTDKAESLSEIRVVKSQFDNTSLYGGDTCCINLASPTDSFIENSMTNFEHFDNKHKLKMPVLSTIMKFTSDGVPEYESVEFKNLISKEINAILYADNMRVMYSEDEGLIKSYVIKEMFYYEYAAGSYFNIEFEYFGSSANLKISSEDISLLTREIYVSKTGKVHETIGFKSKGPIIQYPLICLGNDTNCVKPESIKKLLPDSGAVDDDTQSDETFNYKHYYEFSTLLFSSITMGLLSIFCIILNVVFLIIFTFLIFRSLSVLMILLCLSKNIEAIVTNIDTDVYFEKCEINNMKINENFYSRLTVLCQGQACSFLGDTNYNPMTAHLTETRSTDIVGPIFIEKPDESGFGYYSGITADVKCEDDKNKTVITNKLTWTGIISYDATKNIAYVCRPDKIGSCLTEARNVNNFDLEKELWSYWKTAEKLNKVVVFKIEVDKSYWKDMGLSSITVLIQEDDPKKNKVFELVSKNYNYIDIDWIQFKPIGVPKATSIVFTVITDWYMPNHILHDRLVKTLNLKDNTMLMIDNPMKNNIIGRVHGSIHCVQKCEVENPMKFDGLKKKIVLEKDHKWSRVLNGISIDFLNDLKNDIKLISSTRTDQLTDREDFTISENWDLKTFKNHKILGNDILENKKIKAKCLSKNLLSLTGPNLIKVDRISHSSLMKYIIVNKDRLITEKGTFETKVGGPIGLNCNYNGVGMYCKHRYNTMHAFFSNTANTGLMLNYVNLTGNRYTYEYDERPMTISPVDEDCTGNLFIDSKSNLICSHHCCLTSDSRFDSFDIISADKNAKMSNGAKTQLSVYNKGKIERHIFSEPVKCSTLSIKTTFECIFDNYKIESIIFYGFVPMMLALYIIVITIVNMSFICSKKIKYSRAVKINRRGRSTKQVLNNVFENMTNGRLNPFKRSPSVKMDDIKYKQMARSRIYRPTID